MSLSLFVWHQVILAYLRYSFIERFDWFSLVLFLFATTIISFISYRTIEKINHKTWLQKAFTSSLLLITTLSALAIYRNAGVVRDVPEFGISKENPFANRNTVYIDSIYQLQKPFETNRIHALIVGNSFARDFASILKEYDVNNDIEISYSPNWNDINKNILSMTEYLFVFGAKHSIPDYIFKEVPKSCKIYGISTKCYGKNFGIFYSKRNTPDYFNLNIPSNSSCDSINKSWEYEWGKDHFINIMDASRLPNGNIRIFTPENKAISFDCRHLTRFGCKYLSNRLNLQSIFKNKNDD